MGSGGGLRERCKSIRIWGVNSARWEGDLSVVQGGVLEALNEESAVGRPELLPGGAGLELHLQYLGMCMR